MKPAAFWIGLFVAGGVLAVVNDVTLGTLWISLQWRKPVADWLLSIGVPETVAAHWGLIWIKLPDWVTLLLLGAVIGRLTRSGKWLRYALVSGLGFIAYSLVYSVWYCLILADAAPFLAMGTFWRLAGWNLASLLLLLLDAWLSSRTARKSISTPAIAES